MLKKLLSLGIVLGFAFSILLPNSFVSAETEDEDTATEEEANETGSDEATEEEADVEESADEEENAAASDDEKEEAAKSTTTASDGPVDFTIYFYVIGFVVVTIIGMYAFTEGIRKK